jgi:hypothetical protein
MMLNEVMEDQARKPYWAWVADPMVDWLGSSTSPIPWQAVDVVGTSR